MKLPVLSPYAKTVVAACASLLAVAYHLFTGDGLASNDTLVTAITGLLTTVGVFGVTNAPVATKSAVTPSSHTVTTSVPKSTKKTATKATKTTKSNKKATTGE